MSKMFFLDFDGTITKKDVVSTMVANFCRNGWQDLGLRWEQGQLSTEDCANKIFELFDASIEEIYQFLDTIALDDYFTDFIKLCNFHNYPVFILSDGYDNLIHYILNKHGLADLSVYANKMVNKNEIFSINCVYKNPHCGKCGTCKKKLLHRLKNISHQVIYAGDGHSDKCVCHEADILFAKNYLWQYCLENSVPANPFNNFLDIINWLNKHKETPPEIGKCF